MNQTPKQTVKAALRFEGPERLPVNMGSLGCCDFMGIPWKAEDRSEEGHRVDEWGCAWEKTEMKNMGQVKGHPLKNLKEHERLSVPDYSADWRYADCEKALQEAERDGRYTVVGIFMILFERMHSLAGFETVLMGLLDDRANAEALADKILGAQISLVQNVQERFGDRLDAFAMTEDWGTQNAAFISTPLWYDFFLPRYKRLFDVMHAGGQDVWVHSCGKVNEVIQGFIDAGVDAVNLQQPRVLGIEEIGKRYRGKVTFESLADIQATLPTGKRELIEADARALAEHWMTPKGGFVFSDYGDDAAIGASPEEKLCMYETFSRISRELYGNPLPAPQTGAS